MAFDEKTQAQLKILWDYNYIRQEPQDADLLLVMGSNDITVAEYAGRIANLHDYKTIVCSGGVAHKDDLLATGWNKSECEIFADVMIQNGVSKGRIILEDQAKNTGDNIVNTRKLLSEAGIEVSTGLLVQKPFMLRRALATADQQWPEIRWRTTSQLISYDEYITHFDEQALANIIVGDTWRIIDYAEKSFQTRQNMPDSVRYALKNLIEKGFVEHIPENHIINI